MYNPVLRIAFVFVSIGFAYFYYIRGDMAGVFIGLIAIPFLIYGYFAYGTVQLAMQELKKDNLNKASKVLQNTKYPNLLSRSYKAYYHFVLGYIYLNEDTPKLKQAKFHFKEADRYGLRTENDRGMTLINISSLELEEGNLIEASKYIELASSYEVKELVKEAFEEVKNKINKAQTK